MITAYVRRMLKLTCVISSILFNHAICQPAPSWYCPPLHSASHQYPSGVEPFHPGISKTAFYSHSVRCLFVLLTPSVTPLPHFRACQHPHIYQGPLSFALVATLCNPPP